MSTIGVVLGTILQLMLAAFLFMAVIFSGAGIANGGNLGRFETSILNFSIYALQAICVASAAIMLYLHRHGGGASSFWWHILPLAGAALYFSYALYLNAGT